MVHRLGFQKKIAGFLFRRRGGRRGQTGRPRGRRLCRGRSYGGSTLPPGLFLVGPLLHTCHSEDHRGFQNLPGLGHLLFPHVGWWLEHLCLQPSKKVAVAPRCPPVAQVRGFCVDNIKHDSHAVGTVPPVPQSGLARRRKRGHALRYALAYLEVRSPQPVLGKTFPNPSFGQPLVPGCFSFRCLCRSLYHERLRERFLREGRRRLGKRRCWIPNLGRARNPRRSDRSTSQSRRVSQSPQKMPRNIDGRRHGIPHVCHILWDPIEMGKQWPWLVAGMGKRPNPYPTSSASFQRRSASAFRALSQSCS